MGLNIGSNLTQARVAFGPAVLALGAAGSTPTENIGFIDPGSPIEIEFQSQMADIGQGNPDLTIFRYIQAQSFFLRCPSIEWSANRLHYALGTGATSIDANNEILRFGGDPLPTEVALALQHRKSTAAHTVNARVWKATTENGGFAIQFGETPHSFGFAWKALRSTTNWAGGTNATDSELVEIDIELQ